MVVAFYRMIVILRMRLAAAFCGLQFLVMPAASGAPGQGSPEPWVGAVGVQETTQQIMARDPDYLATNAPRFYRVTHQP
jgi:hypothetical protein